MKLAIMQPYFMPYLGYWQAIAAVDKYLLYDKVNYIKKGWINRNRINILNIGATYITVPLKNASSNAIIKDVQIDDSINWRKKILDLIYFNYKKSPFFNEIYPMIQDCVNIKEDFISDYNYKIISKLSCKLGVNSIIEKSDADCYDILEERLSQCVDADKRKIDRVISICRMNGADTYINAIGGQDMYHKDAFLKENVKLNFIEMDPNITYQQCGSDFIPGLSIVDVLLNNGIEGTSLLLNKFSLI